MTMSDAFICDAVRTPIGKKNGSLAATRADDLAGTRAAAKVVERLRRRTRWAVEDVVMGCVTQIGEQGWKIGRTAALDAGLPIEVCGTSAINRMCGSSLQTTNFVAQAIMSGQQEVGEPPRASRS